MGDCILTWVYYTIISFSTCITGTLISITCHHDSGYWNLPLFVPAGATSTCTGEGRSKHEELSLPGASGIGNRLWFRVNVPAGYSSYQSIADGTSHTPNLPASATLWPLLTSSYSWSALLPRNFLLPQAFCWLHTFKKRILSVADTFGTDWDSVMTEKLRFGTFFWRNSIINTSN